MTKPFDFEAAKRGEPIMLIDGTPAKFIAYVPEAAEPYRVVVMVEGWGAPALFSETGVNAYKDDVTLVMAPKKRTVWVNLYPGCANALVFPTQEEADSYAAERFGNRAWPLEIEE